MEQMGAHELFCWNYLLTANQQPEVRGAVLSVEDEIAAWG